MSLVKRAKTPCTLFAALAALCLGTQPAPAEVLVSSLTSTSSIVNFSIGAWAGSPFRTDNQSWTLTSATVTLELGSTNVSTANVRLMSDAGGKPGTSLADLGTKSVTGGSQPYLFSSVTNLTLTNSTTYWIVVGNVSTNGGLNVRLSQPGEPFTNTAVAGAFMTNSISAGTSVGQIPPTNWTPASSGIALLFAVEGVRSGGGGTNTNAGPQLTLTLQSPTNAVITWPTNAVGYVLQSTPILPAITWTTITNGIVTVGTQYTYRLNPTNGLSFFYRLFKP